MTAKIDELDQKILETMIGGYGVGAKMTELASELSESRSTINLSPREALCQNLKLPSFSLHDASHKKSGFSARIIFFYSKISPLVKRSGSHLSKNPSFAKNKWL